MHDAVAVVDPRKHPVGNAFDVRVIQVMAAHRKDDQIYQDMYLHQYAFQPFGDLKAAERSHEQEHKKRVPCAPQICELHRHYQRFLAFGEHFEQIADVAYQSRNAAEEQIQVYLPFQFLEYDPAFKYQSEYAEILH